MSKKLTESRLKDCRDDYNKRSPITHWILFGVIIVISLFLSNHALAIEERFPAPEFESSYEIPSHQQPSARAIIFEYLDVIVLLGALIFSAFMALKRRSRLGLYLTTIFSVLYFGFFREGCICPIGSIQNVTLALANNSYIVPITVILFFVLPLVFALFFGRVFCASVCPLGAIQELVIIKPIKLPGPIKHTLGLIPYLYLGLALLFTVTGSGFIICRFDPFIELYRLSGPPGAFILGSIFLITGFFIARPYCRFFCPYGVLLGFMSFFSKSHLKITPDECIQCKLCEQSCPSDCIDSPSPKRYQTTKANEVKKLGLFLALAPIIMMALGFGFSQLTNVFARMDHTVQLAERIHQEESGQENGTTLDSDAFRQAQNKTETLYDQADKKRGQFKLGLWLIGLFIGLVLSLKMFILIRRSNRKDYEPDRFHCISCGRCMEYCPVKKQL